MVADSHIDNEVYWITDRILETLTLEDTVVQ